MGLLVTANFPILFLLISLFNFTRLTKSLNVPSIIHITIIKQININIKLILFSLLNYIKKNSINIK